MTGALAGAGLTATVIAVTSALASWSVIDVGSLELSSVRDGWAGDATRLFIALVAGVVVSVTDIREHRIPNLVTMPTAAAILGSAVIESLWHALEAATANLPWLPQLEPLALSLLGLCGAGAVYFALAWFGTLGLGDVKLAAVLGAALLPAFGWPALATAFVAAYVIACPHATALLIVRRRSGTPGGELAFGPYLVAGAFVAVALAIASGE